MRYAFEYGFAKTRDLRIDAVRSSTTGKATVRSIEVDGEPILPTPRFWRSFFARFGISDSVFKYFDHAEVFERISERARDDAFRYCIERRDDGRGRLLAVSNPARPVAPFEELESIVHRYDGASVDYHEGVLSSVHVPRLGDRVFRIGGDEFKHRFVLDAPIDGYGQPKIHLSFLRMLCANGAVGYSKAFRSELNVGKDPLYSMVRALESFDNGDGYSALRQRFESSQKSWASIHECNHLYKTLMRLRNSGRIDDASVLGRWRQVAGNLHEIYGLANLDALSAKRQRVLPAGCRVYDLINFSSEVATHHADAAGNRVLQAYLGSLISDEYDMEGTAETVTDFRDFFLDPSDGRPPVSLN